MNGKFIQGIIDETEAKKATAAKKETVTFENFGMKALEQMGWKQGKVIGRNPISYSDKIYEIKPRMQGLGLGALSQQEQEKAAEDLKSKANDLQIAFNSIVFIISGKHAGMSGVLKSHRGDATYVIEVNSEDILVERAHFSDIDPKLALEPANDQSGEKPKKKKARSLRWVQPGLLIRIVSKTYHDGKYYLKKGSVIDLAADSFFVMLENSTLLEGLKEKDVETVVPALNAPVMIVKGEKKGHGGTVLQKERSGNKVWIKESIGNGIVELTADMCCALSDH